jgi:hypothetical protein
MKSHEPTGTGGRPSAAVLTGREVRRLTDIVLVAESGGSPVPAIAAITPGLTLEDAFRIRQEAFARRLAVASEIAAVVAVPDSPVRFYTDCMVRRRMAHEPSELQLTAQPVVLFRVGAAGLQATAGIEVRRVPAAHPGRQVWHIGHDEICTNGGAHLLIVPESDGRDGTGNRAIEDVIWSADDVDLRCDPHSGHDSEAVVAAIARALDELSAEIPDRESAIDIGVEPLAPAISLPDGGIVTLQFAATTPGRSGIPATAREHHLTFAVTPHPCQNGK